MWARWGKKDWWPARVCDAEENAAYLCHRRLESHVCVFFLGDHTYYWLTPSQENIVEWGARTIPATVRQRPKSQLAQGVREAKWLLEHGAALALEADGGSPRQR